MANAINHHALTSRRKSSKDAGSGYDGDSRLTEFGDVGARGRRLLSMLKGPTAVAGISDGGSVLINPDRDAQRC